MRSCLALVLAATGIVACEGSGYVAALPTTSDSCITQNCTIPPGDLVFDSDRTGNHEIWTMRSDGGSPRQITNDAGLDNWRPRLAPDRRRILFYRSVAGHAGDSTVASLWMVNADGTGLVRVRTAGQDGWTMQGHAEWSPNGQQLAMYGGVGGGSQIFVTERNGTIVRQVTNRAGYNLDPSWSSDQSRLVFSGCAATPCTAADYEIYTVPATGGSETRLTNNSRPDYDPSYSPNGADVLWVQKTSDAGNGTRGTWGLELLTVQGGALRTLLNDGQVNDAPSWSSNGAVVYFRRMEPATSSRWRIFVVQSGGAGVQEVNAAAPGNNEYPGR